MRFGAAIELARELAVSLHSGHWNAYRIRRAHRRGVGVIEETLRSDGQRCRSLVRAYQQGGNQAEHVERQVADEYERVAGRVLAGQAWLVPSELLR